MRVRERPEWQRAGRFGWWWCLSSPRLEPRWRLGESGGPAQTGRGLCVGLVGLEELSSGEGAGSSTSPGVEALFCHFLLSFCAAENVTRRCGCSLCVVQDVLARCAPFGFLWAPRAFPESDLAVPAPGFSEGKR